MADEATPSPIPEVPADLDALNDAELTGLHGEFMAARAALYVERGEEGVSFARLREIRGQVQQIDQHLATLAAAVTERMEVANDLAAAETEIPALPEPPATPEAPAPAAEAETPETPAVESTDTPTDAPVPVTAAVSAEEIAAEREPGTAPPAAHTRPRVASLTAPAGSRIVEPGTAMDLADIGAAMGELARGESFNGKVRVAGLASFEATHELYDQMLRMGDVHRNDALIHESVVAWREQYDANRAARQGGTHTAAICDPLDIIREIPDCVQSREPFADSLPSRPVGRLGYQFTPSMALADMADGVVIWTEDDQAAVDPTDPTTWKPCVNVDCPTPSSVKAETIPACFSFDNTTDLSNPEIIRQAMSKINAQRARNKEGRLLQIADGLSHHYDVVGAYGALPELVRAIITVLPQGEYPERLDDGTPYIAYTPPGLLEALVGDRVGVGYLTDAMRGSVQSFVEDECAAAGWNVSLVDIEDVALGQAAPFAPLNDVGIANRTNLPGIGDVFRVRLLAPEAALYGSSGSIEMGIERSPELNRQNRAQWFAEEYVMLTKHGCQPWYTLHIDLCDSGARAGLVTPIECSGSGS